MADRVGEGKAEVSLFCRALFDRPDLSFRFLVIETQFAGYVVNCFPHIAANLNPVTSNRIQVRMRRHAILSPTNMPRRLDVQDRAHACEEIPKQPIHLYSLPRSKLQPRPYRECKPSTNTEHAFVHGYLVYRPVRYYSLDFPGPFSYADGSAESSKFTPG